MNPNVVQKKEHFAAIVGAARDRLGMTQDQFAAYLGVPPITANHWERGLRKPSACAIRLLEVLGEVERLAPEVHALLIPDPTKVKRAAAKRRKAPFDSAVTLEAMPLWLFAAGGTKKEGE